MALAEPNRFRAFIHPELDKTRYYTVSRGERFGLMRFHGPMKSTNPLQILAQRQKISFFYERASNVEAAAMDALYHVGCSLSLAISAPRKQLPPRVCGALDLVVCAIKRSFIDAARIIRNGSTFRALADCQRAELEAKCFSIQFYERDDYHRAPARILRRLP